MVTIAAILTSILCVLVSQPLPGRQGQDPNPADSSLYCGSQRCGQCHEGEYNYWKITPHASMVRVPDWSDSELLQQLVSEGLPFPKEKVDLVIGNLKILVFLTRQGQDFVVLPRQYNIYMGRWEDFTEDEWEPHLQSSGQRTEEGQVSWKQRCVGCHTTGYDPITSEFVELSVGCEECHGPGASHARSTDKDEIINPRSLPHERAIAVCGQCHSRGVSKNGTHPFTATFVPGDLLSDHFDVLQPTEGVNTEAFWGNGMARRHHEQYQEVVQSRHYQVGLACFDCHEGHKFRLGVGPDGLQGTLGANRDGSPGPPFAFRVCQVPHGGGKRVRAGHHQLTGFRHSADQERGAAQPTSAGPQEDEGRRRFRGGEDAVLMTVTCR